MTAQTASTVPLVTVTIANASLQGAVVRIALYHEMGRLLGMCDAIMRERSHLLARPRFATAVFSDSPRAHFERQFWACADLWLALCRGELAER